MRITPSSSFYLPPTNPCGGLPSPHMDGEILVGVGGLVVLGYKALAYLLRGRQVPLSDKEKCILTILSISSPMVGRDIFKASAGKLSTSDYLTLAKMETKGLVRIRPKDLSNPKGGPPLLEYHITEIGLRAIKPGGGAIFR